MLDLTCSGITGSGFWGLKRLRKIILCRCSNIRNEFLSSLRGVRDIDLSCCPQIDDGGISSIMGTEKINLFGTAITVTGLKRLELVNEGIDIITGSDY